MILLIFYVSFLVFVSFRVFRGKIKIGEFFMNFLRTLFIIFLIILWSNLSFADDLIIHYHRSNGDYDEWSLWTWEIKEDNQLKR